MRPKFCRTVWSLALPFIAVAFSAAQMKCPDMPDKITQVNHDVMSDVNASVGSLGKLRAGQLEVKTDVVAKNLFEKYPNTDRILIAQMMTAMFCPLVRDNATLKDAEKLHLVTEFSDHVYKFVNSDYKPGPSVPSKPKVTSNANSQTPSTPQAEAAKNTTAVPAPVQPPNTLDCGGGNCAVSTGQQGGITAGQINIDTDRALTNGDAMNMIAKLENHKGKVAISAMGEAEQVNLAMQLNEVLAHAPGWEGSHTQTRFLMLSYIVHGIEVQVPKGQEDNGNALVAALQAARLKAYTIPKTDSSGLVGKDDEIGIVIGMKH